MSNSCVLVGRLTKDIEGDTILLAVNRSFKNETDFIPVEVWGGISENAKEYCHKGDLVGIRGRLETKENKLVVIAEKMTFLSSKHTEE